MIIDVKAVRDCSRELRMCLRRMETLHDSTRSVYTQLSGSDIDSIRDISYDLRRSLQKTERQITQIRTMIRALERIADVYERTERKNETIADRVFIPVGRVPGLINLPGMVPVDISDLFE